LRYRSNSAARFESEKAIRCDAPRLPLCCVRDIAAIMTKHSLAKIMRATDVEALWVGLALQNINVSEPTHSAGLPSRSSQHSRCKRERPAFAEATARQSSLTTLLRAKTGGEGS
jgi:hypothetical protein